MESYLESKNSYRIILGVQGFLWNHIRSPRIPMESNQEPKDLESYLESKDSHCIIFGVQGFVWNHY